MAWELKADRAIYLQLMEHIKLCIIAGEYPAGGRLPPVRELAAEAEVNPNTMQKALSELEREELLLSQRTAGRFITPDAELIGRVKDTLAREKIQVFFSSMQALGYDKSETVRLLQQAAEEEVQ